MKTPPPDLLLLAVPFAAFLGLPNWPAVVVLITSAALFVALRARALLESVAKERAALDAFQFGAIEETLRETNRRVVALESRITTVDNRTRPTPGGR